MVKGLIGAMAAAALVAAGIVVVLDGMLQPRVSNACGYRPMGSHCDGWSAGRPKSATIAFLYMNDIEFADWLLAHNEHGRDACGWKPKPN